MKTRIAIVLSALLLCLLVSAAAFAGAAPVTTPLPAAPLLGWCYNGPVPNAANDVTVRLGDCPAPPPTAGCPATIQTPTGPRTLVRIASISYGVYPLQRQNVNVTTWDGLWGYNSVTGPVTPWPGVGGAAPVIRAFPKAGYLCAKFRTPANVMTRNGGFTNPSYINGPDVVMAISRIAGDFSVSLPTPACLIDRGYGGSPWSGVPTSDSALVQWKGTTNAPAYFCNLQPNTDYYVNVTFASPSDCASPSGMCPIGPVSAHN